MARTRGQDRYESPDVGAMVARMLNALVRRAGDGDLEAVEQLHTITCTAPDALARSARAAHEAGYSWTAIAAATGTSRQGARQRFAS